MLQYKLILPDNTYNSWELRDAVSLNETELPGFSPDQQKLFNFDVFTVDNNKKAILIHSVVRSMPIIGGILKLSDGKTYGKEKNKFLVKCIPDDKRIPPFLVPYGKQNISFSKNVKNKYVTFKFIHWDNKHPQGQLHSVIGDVDVLENFYEYQLYCKSLYASIQDFTKAAKKKLHNESLDDLINKIDKSYNPVDRTDPSWEIYTIDPEKSKDFDDAFSCKKISDSQSILSIYITNVAIWMEAMELWSSFSERISTIYLPDRRRPMLPAIMSEYLCSLLEGELRYAFTLDILVHNDTGNIIEHKFINTKIKVKKNFIYKNDLSNNETVNNAKKLMILINKHYKLMDTIKDNHDLVAILMVLMNYLSAKEFLKYESGIFRSMKLENSVKIPEHLPDDVKVFLKLWKSSGSKYIRFEENKVHEMLKFNEYVHITSPIRRLVDLLNILSLQHHLKMIKFTKQSNEFYSYWTSDDKLDYINQTMRAIRKVQNECNLLTMCITNKEITEKNYSGYIFDAINRNDGLYQYVIFVKELKIVSKFISYQKLDLFENYVFKVYLFEDKESLKQKVRFEIQL